MGQTCGHTGCNAFDLTNCPLPLKADNNGGSHGQLAKRLGVALADQRLTYEAMAESSKRFADASFYRPNGLRMLSGSAHFPRRNCSI